MGGFSDELRRRGRAFFTNWSRHEGGVAEKLGLTVRNRIRALGGGCCGHPGEPGC